MIGSTIRNTANPTMLAAGYKTNVIPARGSHDRRPVPARPGRRTARDDRRADRRAGSSANSRSATSPSRRASTALSSTRWLRRSRSEDPGAEPVPYLMSGGTDAKSFSTLGIRCFGFSPSAPAERLRFRRMFHGIDERVPVDGLHFGVRVLDRFLSNCLTCCSSTWPRPPTMSGRVARPGQGGPARRAAAAAVPDGDRGRRCPGCPASCRSARSVSAGRRCATLPPPAADADADRRGGGRDVHRDRRGRRRRLAGAPARAARPPSSARPPTPSRRSCAGCSAASCGRARWPASWPTPSPGPPTCRSPTSAARRCFGGDLPAVAAAALAGGAAALAGFRLQVGRPLGPMLAQTADRAPTTRWTGSAATAGVRVRSSTASGSRCTATATTSRFHPQPRRHHRPAARGRRGSPRAAGRATSCRRRGDRAARRTGGRSRSRSPRPGSARATPDAGRRLHAVDAVRLRRCCTSTATTCSTHPARSAAAVLDRDRPGEQPGRTGW